MKEKFAHLEKEIGVEFKDKNKLIQAFCHRSYLNENPDFDLGHNERVEFLGDAVLELVVTSYLYFNYPDRSEGELTTWRAALVNTKVIGELANELGFQEYILLSKGERRENGKARTHLLADVFEAFVGAIYLDSGYDAAKKFIEEKLITKLPYIIEKGLYRDPKSELQEKTQEEVGVTPAYKILQETGPDHQKHFVMGVFLEENLVGRGEGCSKKEAEEEAAKEALEKKSWSNEKN